MRHSTYIVGSLKGIPIMVHRWRYLAVEESRLQGLRGIDQWVWRATAATICRGRKVRRKWRPGELTDLSHRFTCSCAHLKHSELFWKPDSTLTWECLVTVPPGMIQYSMMRNETECCDTTLALRCQVYTTVLHLCRVVLCRDSVCGEKGIVHCNHCTCPRVMSCSPFPFRRFIDTLLWACLYHMFCPSSLTLGILAASLCTAFSMSARVYQAQQFVVKEMTMCAALGLTHWMQVARSAREKPAGYPRRASLGQVQGFYRRIGSAGTGSFQCSCIRI